MSRLGDLIRLERTRQGLTYKQVARKCGVSDKYLMEVEAGTRIIADDQARRILKTMGMTEHTEADFSLDDIAATVDLQSAVPQLTKAVEKKKAPQQAEAEPAAESDPGVSGSIWLDALSGVLKHVPVYNAVMKEVGHRLLRKVKRVNDYQAMLQKYDEGFESEIKNYNEITFVGRCVRLEADLT